MNDCMNCRWKEERDEERRHRHKGPRADHRPVDARLGRAEDGKSYRQLPTPAPYHSFETPPVVR